MVRNRIGRGAAYSRTPRTTPTPRVSRRSLSQLETSRDLMPRLLSPMSCWSPTNQRRGLPTQLANNLPPPQRLSSQSRLPQSRLAEPLPTLQLPPRACRGGSGRRPTMQSKTMSRRWWTRTKRSCVTSSEANRAPCPSQEQRRPDGRRTNTNPNRSARRGWPKEDRQGDRREAQDAIGSARRVLRQGLGSHGGQARSYIASLSMHRW